MAVAKVIRQEGKQEPELFTKASIFKYKIGDTVRYGKPMMDIYRKNLTQYIGYGKILALNLRITTVTGTQEKSYIIEGEDDLILEESIIGE